MSSCYKCGRDLPDGVVECEPQCPTAGKQPVGEKELIVTITICLKPDLEKIVTEADAAAYADAQVRFGRMIAECFARSGLRDWCKNVKS